jgi:transposase
MPLPFAAEVSLTDEQRQQLEKLARAASTPQSLAFRARVVLRAAAADRPPNLQIAAEFGCSRHTAGKWRDRFLDDGLSGLQDAPRSGRPPRISPLDAG